MLGRIVIAKLVALDVAPGDRPPAEFRLFKSGENETTKGLFLFDAKAAELVMAAAKARGGVDYPIDLEHLSLESTDSRGFDPDARGWFSLAVRNGELWAVNVRWTPDGLRRLSEKTQRYVSPAFCVDGDNRITEIVNVALVAMPATQGTPALVAANRSTMKNKTLVALLARLSIAQGKIKKLADDGAESEAAAGKFAQVQSAAKKAEEALAALESVTDVDQAMSAAAAAVDAMKECEAAIGALTGAASAPESTPAPAPEAASDAPKEDEEKKQQMARDRAELIALRAEKRRREEDAQVQKLAAEIQQKNEDRATLSTKYGHMPAVAEFLASKLSANDLRQYVELVSKAGTISLGGPKAPVGGGGGSGDGSKVVMTSLGPVTLTANQLRECELAKAKPEAFAENIARRTLAGKR